MRRGSRVSRGRAAALAALVCAVTAACGPDPRLAPDLETRTPGGLPASAWAPSGWTFALVTPPGGPDLRYGVAGPDRGAPSRQVLYLPGYGAVSEEIFPLARTLLDRGIETWTLEAAGQGGSGRVSLPRTLGESHGFDADEAGLAALVARAIRPGAEGAPPLTLAAEGSAAAVALDALSRRPFPVSRLVLLDPAFEPPAAAPRTPWPAPSGAEPRLEARRAWVSANPDLAVGPPGPRWRDDFTALLARIRPDRLAALSVPAVLVLPPDASERARSASGRICAELPKCVVLVADEAAWPDVLGAGSAVGAPAGHAP